MITKLTRTNKKTRHLWIHGEKGAQIPQGHPKVKPFHLRNEIIPKQNQQTSWIGSFFLHFTYKLLRNYHQIIYIELVAFDLHSCKTVKSKNQRKQTCKARSKSSNRIKIMKKPSTTKNQPGSQTKLVGWFGDPRKTLRKTESFTPLFWRSNDS